MLPQGHRSRHPCTSQTHLPGWHPPRLPPCASASLQSPPRCRRPQRTERPVPGAPAHPRGRCRGPRCRWRRGLAGRRPGWWPGRGRRRRGWLLARALHAKRCTCTCAAGSAVGRVLELSGWGGWGGNDKGNKHHRAQRAGGMAVRERGTAAAAPLNASIAALPMISSTGKTQCRQNPMPVTPALGRPAQI